MVPLEHNRNSGVDFYKTDKNEISDKKYYAQKGH